MPAGTAREVLRVDVEAMRGASGQAWSINVSAQVASGESTAVGSINPYPPESLGAFSFPLATAVRETLAARGGLLVFTLTSASGTALRAALEVTIAVTWADPPSGG